MIADAGSHKAALWIVGRDGGETERRLGQPFVGRAGSILNRALTQAGLRREDCFITNVVQEQPPANDWKRHRPGAIAAGVAELQGKLLRHKPRLVVALGNEAFRACLGVDPDDSRTLPSITEARGYLWDYFLEGGINAPVVQGTGGLGEASNDGSASLRMDSNLRRDLRNVGAGAPADTAVAPHFRVLAAIHPAAADREWVPWRVLLDVDLKKAAKELALCKDGYAPFPKRRVSIVTEDAEVEQIIKLVKSGATLSLDIEGDHTSLDCLGVAASTKAAYVIPGSQRDLIGYVCESANPKVLQNGAYDRYTLSRFYGIEIKNQTFDTMLAFHALMPELAGQKIKVGGKKGARHTMKKLSFFASIWTREPWYKNYDFANETEKFILCGKDVCVTLEVAQRLEEALA